MKKKSIKILLLALVLFIMPIVVKAETYIVTVTNSGPGHTYQAYQIFAGTVANGGLKDLTWGSGVNTTTLFAAEPTWTDPKIPANTLSTESAARQFAGVIGNYLTTPTASCQISNGTTCVMTNLPGGYYLIKDTDASLDNSEEIYTPYILAVVQSRTISPKMSDRPYVDHYIESLGYVQQGAATVGEELTFSIVGELPSDYTQYEHYKMTFNSELGTGFDAVGANASVKVFVGTANPQEITTGFTTSVVNNKITVTFNDLKTITGVTITNNTQIEVQYKAKLNSSLVTQGVGNTNTAYLTFSNNPNAPTQDTGLTSEVLATVYTGELRIRNADEDGEDLPGASYSIYKLAEDPDDPSTEIVGSVDSNGVVTFFKGIGSGNYILKQDERPNGYEEVADIEIAITVDDSSGVIQVVSISNDDDTEIDTQTGYTEITIKNTYNALLAFTGGRGTLVFTITGLVIMLVAGAIYKIRKRNRELYQ